MTLLHTKTY